MPEEPSSLQANVAALCALCEQKKPSPARYQAVLANIMADLSEGCEVTDDVLLLLPQELRQVALTGLILMLAEALVK